jgi:uncharacterized protein (TIGR01244 family)
MLLDKFPKKWRLIFLCTLISISVIAVAQEQRERVPGQMLPPQFANILLMDSRVNQERPDKALQFMGLKDGDIVADIGCGNGFFTLRLAKEIGPHGVVFAVDVQQGMLDQLNKRQKELNLSNIYPILGQFEDPLLPPGKVDWIMLVDAYHEFSNPKAMLARMKECLAPGGRVALIEYRGEQNSSKGGFQIPHDHAMTVDQVAKEWRPAGFELVTTVEFLPIQHFFVLKNADDKSRPAIRRLKIENTPNVSTFDHKIFFAGQPDEKALGQFAGFGVKTVVNLRSDREMAGLAFDEKSVIEKAGMKYVQAPVGLGIPDVPTLRKILDALNSVSDAPVLLHCADSNRVGAMWALYTGQRNKLTVDEAIAEGKTAGMSKPTLEKAVREALSQR